RGRGPALSRHRRLLLPRGDLARSRRDARPDRAWYPAGRNPPGQARQLSADRGRARDRRGDLEELVRAALAARCRRDAARPPRPDLWRTEHAMTPPRYRSLAALALVLASTLVLAGCNEQRDPGFQGWVEADMIFVSPDESGRVTK